MIKKTICDIQPDIDTPMNFCRKTHIVWEWFTKCQDIWFNQIFNELIENRHEIKPWTNNFEFCNIIWTTLNKSKLNCLIIKSWNNEIMNYGLELAGYALNGLKLNEMVEIGQGLCCFCLSR